jgi:DNA-binding CsgD family transcriptional regulator
MTPAAPHAVVDRERALREVDALIGEACEADSAAVVRIAGPPGIGKTTFLRYVLERRPRLPRTLVARAEPFGRLRQAACVRTLLGNLVPPDADEDELQFAVDLALAGGATLAIDDAQWLDEISERLVRAAIRKHRSELVVMFTDRRETSEDLQPHRTVRLQPLRTTAAIGLVRQLYPRAAPRVASEIVSAAAGIPFGVKFLAVAAAQRAAGVPQDVDQSIAAAIGARLERSSERAREVVRHCALLDAPANLRVVARATALTVADAAEAVTELVDLVVVEDLHAVFRHALIADGVAGAIDNVVPYYRRLLDAHDRLDERVETQGSVLRCARGCGDDRATAESALRLGRLFAASGSLLTSLEHFGIALRHAPRPLPAVYALEYASTLQQLARDEDAAQFLRTELRSAISRADAETVAELMTSFTSVALTLELFAELDALSDRVATLIDAHAPERLATLHTARLSSLGFAGRVDEAECFAASIRSRWQDGRALAFAAGLNGQAAVARKHFEIYRAGLGVEHERLARGDRALSATISLFSVGTSALRAIEEGWGDDRDRGTYATGTALRILRRINDNAWREIDTIVEHLRLDDPEFAEPYAVLDARLLFCGIFHQVPVPLDRTLSSLRTMIVQGRRRHAIAAACWYWIACSYANSGVPDDVKEFVYDELGAQPMPYLIGGIPLAVSLLAPLVGVERCARALEQRPAFRAKWHRAHSELATGVLLDDHAALRRARDLFDELDAPVFAAVAGMRLPVPRAADVLVHREMLLATEAGETLAPPSLTNKELEVAELAAQGLSNREIGVRFRIVDRTVEQHLTRAFRKLGITRRGQLREALLRLVRRKT